MRGNSLGLGLLPGGVVGHQEGLQCPSLHFCDPELSHSPTPQPNHSPRVFQTIPTKIPWAGSTKLPRVLLLPPPPLPTCTWSGPGRKSPALKLQQLPPHCLNPEWLHRASLSSLLEQELCHQGWTHPKLASSHMPSPCANMH